MVYKVVRQRFSLGNNCECMCHGKPGIVDFCGYVLHLIETCSPEIGHKDNNIFALVKPMSPLFNIELISFICL